MSYFLKVGREPTRLRVLPWNRPQRIFQKGNSSLDSNCVYPKFESSSDRDQRWTYCGMGHEYDHWRRQLPRREETNQNGPADQQPRAELLTIGAQIEVATEREKQKSGHWKTGCDNYFCKHLDGARGLLSGRKQWRSCPLLWLSVQTQSVVWRTQNQANHFHFLRFLWSKKLMRKFWRRCRKRSWKE